MQTGQASDNMCCKQCSISSTAALVKQRIRYMQMGKEPEQAYNLFSCCQINKNAGTRVVQCAKKVQGRAWGTGESWQDMMQSRTRHQNDKQPYQAPAAGTA